MKKSLALLFLICCFSATVKSKTTKNVSNFTTNLEVITSINNESPTLGTAFFEAPTKNTGDEDLRPKFRIGFDAPQIDHRQLLLTMDENTTDGYDWGYDAEIYEIFNDDMYWLIDQKKYVIQATNDIVIGKEIPLGIVTVEGGTISIGIDALENPIDGIRVCILDKELNIIRDIQESVYQITLPAGEYHNRFAITFVSANINLDEINVNDRDITDRDTKEDDKSSINNIIDQQLLMYVNNGSSTINVKNKQLIHLNNFVLYNKLGQITQTWEQNLNLERLSLSIVNAKSGIYIIQANTENGTITKRVVISYK